LFPRINKITSSFCLTPYNHLFLLMEIRCLWWAKA